MWKCKKRFALAGFLHYNILELKDLLFVHSYFIDAETEVWGNCELPEVEGQSSLQSVQLGGTLSLERFWGEEVGLWGPVVLTPVALAAWSVYLGAVFLNWPGVLNTENLFTAPFSNHSTQRPQWQTAKGKQRKRGDGPGLLWESGLPTTETIAVMLIEVQTCFLPKSSISYDWSSFLTSGNSSLLIWPRSDEQLREGGWSST